MRRRVWRFAHNVFVHPAMELLPAAVGDRLHDWTGKHAFLEKQNSNAASLEVEALDALQDLVEHADGVAEVVCPDGGAEAVAQAHEVLRRAGR